MKTNPIVKCILACILLLIQVTGYSQKKEKSDIKKANLLPIYLVYTGLPSDTALNRIVKEAFTRHKVKLINKTEFEQMNQNELMRIVTKLKAPGTEFRSEREIMEAAEKEQRFVSNMLIVNFTTRDAGDSVLVPSASWAATPYPPNISSSRSSGDIETVLENTCCSVKENLFAIVDKILFSKWLR